MSTLLATLLGSDTGRRAVLVCAIALALLAGITWLHHSAYRQGREAVEAEAAKAAATAERERIKDDARLQGLSDYQLCADYVGARGLPDDTCKSLRRVPAE